MHTFTYPSAHSPAHKPTDPEPTHSPTNPSTHPPAHPYINSPIDQPTHLSIPSSFLPCPSSHLYIHSFSFICKHFNDDDGNDANNDDFDDNDDVPLVVMLSSCSAVSTISNWYPVPGGRKGGGAHWQKSQCQVGGRRGALGEESL